MGVLLCAAPATLLIARTRGSLREYSLSAKSARDTVLSFFASTSTCASFDISQYRKFQAWAVCEESLETPIPSPPTNVEAPPLTPGMGATPTSTVFAAVESRVAGYGITPILPSWNAATQVAPVSSLLAGSPAPNPHRSCQVL